jgi:selenocysteine lyase/cysteine desulfurase
MQNRRRFLQQSSALGIGALGLNSFFQQLQAKEFDAWDQTWEETDISNEGWWKHVQEGYTATDSDIIILNNGGVSPSPIPVQKALEAYNKVAAKGPSYYMWRLIDTGREPLRQQLSQLAGCDAEEIAINRNSTEALNTLIFGLPLQRGDEVVGCLQDYPNMINAWKQRQQREGIVYKQLSFDFPIEDDEQIVRAYEQAITPRTRILHITHVINWVGQIMPVQKICRMAKSKGIEVLVDGAHSFGLLDFTIPGLGCDYFGTSLHKFLSAPVGSGMLWIKKEHIGKIWPLLCNDKPLADDIRKFETLGTRSFCIEQAICEAIHFHNGIGSKRKQERIHYLKKYWAEQAMQIPKVRIHTSLKPEHSCAIAGVSIDGLKAEDLDKKLLDDYKIHTVGIQWENIHCVRVTPHVYTRIEHLDRLLEGLSAIAKKV